jgi:hypothetical protein
MDVTDVYQMPIASLMGVAIILALFLPLAIVAWKYPKAYRIGAIWFIGLLTLAFIIYESYHMGVEKMYKKAWESSNYNQRPLPWTIKRIDPDSLRNAMELHGVPRIAFSERLVVVAEDTTFQAYQKTIQWWVDTLPSKLESAYLNTDPLHWHPVFLNYILLCLMLWGFTYLHRLKKTKTV